MTAPASLCDCEVARRYRKSDESSCSGKVFSRNSFSSIYFHRNHKPNVSVSRENSARFQHVTAALWRHPTPGTGRMPRITGVAVCTTTALVPLTCLIGHNNLKIIISPVLSPTSTFQFYPFSLSLTTNTQRAITFSVPTVFIGEQKVKLSFGREVIRIIFHSNPLSEIEKKIIIKRVTRAAQRSNRNLKTYKCIFRINYYTIHKFKIISIIMLQLCENN